MNSISSTSMDSMTQRTMFQQALTSQISAGSVDKGDQSALSSAIDSIDKSLGTSSSSGPRGGKDKVESLLKNQVSSGALTESQASTLSNLFSAMAANAPGGGGGAQGPNGGPPSKDGPPPKLDGQNSASSTNVDTSISDALETFLNSLNSDSASTSYGSKTSSTSSAFTALLFDKVA